MFCEQINSVMRGFWALSVKHILNELNFGFLWNNMVATGIQLNNIIERLYDQYCQDFYALLNSQPKNITYKTIKVQFYHEKY